MRRSEPPPLATWMLEHCVPVEHADALAGDLLEDYRAGRSDGWYWRQTLSACAVSWVEGLRARIPIALFALLWSMLAPAWKVFVDGLDNAAAFDRILVAFGPLWIIVAFCGWLLLHSLFLWAGILLYYVANTGLGKTFRDAKISRAFLLAPLVFALVYGATMVWGALYWYSFFANARLASTTLGKIADLQMLADVIRLPFFVALVSALWKLVPHSARKSRAVVADIDLFKSSAQSGLEVSAGIVRRFLAYMVSIGLINAMIAAFVLCRLPASHTPTLESLILRAAIYVAVGAMAGMIGTYLYCYSPMSPFRDDLPVSFRHFALVCGAGWVWVPAMALFYEQMSGAAALVAGIGAFFLAVGLRQSTFSVFGPGPQPASEIPIREFDLFAESLYRPRGEVHGYVIALSLCAALAAIATEKNLVAAALLAIGTFLFAWKQTFISSADRVLAYRRSAMRVALVAIPAVLVTVWAILDGVSLRNRVKVAGIAPADHTQAALVDPAKRARQQSASAGAGGYESLILWPYPEKKPMVAPVPANLSFLGHGTTQPLIIRFDGPYWYLQPPDKRPGPGAHQAHGTPLGAGIRTVNELPLVMDAHQTLGASIPIARCREIEVEIENHDSQPGSIAMAVLLTDGSTAGKPELYLGQQPIPPAEAEPMPIDAPHNANAASALKDAPALQMIRFTIPAAAKIRRFDEITVMMLPDTLHAHDGPRIVVQEFELLPR